MSNLISFSDISSSDVEEYEDEYAVEQTNSNGINIHFNVYGDNNDIDITFGGLSGNYGTGKDKHIEKEEEHVCDNVRFGTGEYCYTYCCDCEEQGAVYDTGSLWAAMPLPMKLLTLPLFLPFAPLGSMRFGSGNLMENEAIEYKPEKTAEPVRASSPSSTSAPVENEEYQELSDSDIAFIDRISEITGDEPEYTKEAYNDLLFSSQPEPEPVQEEKVVEDESYDIFSNPENQHLFKSA